VTTGTTSGTGTVGESVPPDDGESTRDEKRALDELFASTRIYRTGKALKELLEFVARFRLYAPYNAMLLHMQMPGARYVAPAHRWHQVYRRRVKPEARPLVILQPMGPVMFVFDVSQTEAEDGALPLPEEVEQPFAVRGAKVGGALPLTIGNAKRDGVLVVQRDEGSQSAGMLRTSPSGGTLDVLTRARPRPEYMRVRLRYELFLNRSHSAEVQYATLVHELGHLYCGHLGTPNARWWPDRSCLPREVEEFEAESISYLVCTRRAIEPPSPQYLNGYLSSDGDIPSISLDCVLKVAGLIEQMGRHRLPPRKHATK
jgi:uncharacterized protein DUF955